MSVLMSRATGNFLTAGTWGLIDATSYNSSETVATALSTTYQASSSFIPGAITVDGIAVKIAVCSAFLTTISVHLAIAGVEVPGTLVTINDSDLPASLAADVNGGWAFFKFAAPVLLVAATLYTVEAKLSAGASVSLFATATTNWARALRTTTTQAPVAGDDLIVCGERTGAGTGNSITVFMDETAATDYGSNTSSTVTPAIAVCSRGALTYGTAAATNYYLKVSGHVIVYGNGSLNIGTVGAEIPRNSSAVLEFDPAADGDMGLIIRNLGQCNLMGLSRTSGKDVYATVLNANAAANAISLTVLDDTGWLDNDQIVVASTTATPGQTELGALNGNAGASSLTVDGFAGTAGGLLNAHGGVSPVVGEIINLTRNVKVRSATSTIMAYVLVNATASFNAKWAEIYYVGRDLGGKQGLTILTTSSGICNVQYCSLHDCEQWGLIISTATGSVTYSNNVHFNLCSQQTSFLSFASISATSGIHTFVNDYFVGCKWSANAATSGFVSLDMGSVYTGLVFAGCTGDLSVCRINEGGTGTALLATNLVSHSNSGSGISVASAPGPAVISGGSFWRNILFGITTTGPTEIAIVSATVFGNGLAGLGANSGTTHWIVRSCTVFGGTTIVQPVGIVAVAGDRWYIFGSTFGSPSAHSSGDISNPSVQVTLWNTTLASTVEVASPSTMHPDNAAVHSHQNDASATTHRNTYRAGIIEADTSVRHTASGFSWKMSPTTSVYKLRLPGPGPFDTLKRAAINGALVTITAYVQKNGTYNGSAPRLVLVGGVIAGVGSPGTDVIAALSVGVNTWELLTVTGTPTEDGVIEWYVDCDGTAGAAYVDDMTFSQVGAPATGSLDIPGRAIPAEYIYAGGGLLANPGIRAGIL